MIDIDYIRKEDIEDIVEIYNSNTKFLEEHLGKEKVDKEFIINEIKEMKSMKFNTFKIINDDLIVGICDIKFEKEAYLSLLMLDNKFRGNGFGKEAFYKIEKMVKDYGCRSIRIDVVYGYDKYVTNFWINNGFTIKELIQLQWKEKNLDAYIMKKIIY